MYLLAIIFNGINLQNPCTLGLELLTKSNLFMPRASQAQLGVQDLHQITFHEFGRPSMEMMMRTE